MSHKKMNGDTPYVVEKPFFSILDSVPDSTLLFNTEGEIIFANKRACSTFGYTFEEFTSISLNDLIPVSFRNAHETHFLKYLKNPAPREMGSGMELFALHKKGHEFPVEISLNEVTDEQHVYIICSIRDITSRKKTEKKLNESYLELKLIDQITQRSLESPSYKTLTSEILTAFEKLNSSLECSMFFYNNPLHKLELIAEWYKNDVLNQEKTLSEDIQTKNNSGINKNHQPNINLKKNEIIILRDKQSLLDIISEFSENTSLQTALSKCTSFLNIQTLLILPYVLNGELFGFTSLSFEKELNTDEIDQIKRFNNRVESILTKAKITEENKKLADIISISGDAILYTNLEGHILSWNTGAEKMFGYKKKEIIGHSIKKIVPKDKMDEFNDTVKMIHNKSFLENYETIRTSKKGERIYVNIAKIPVLDEQGNLQGFWASYRDVSDRKRSTMALEKTTRTLQEAQKIAKIGNWEWNPIKDTVTWSDELYQIFDISPSEIELSYNSYIDLLHPDDQQKATNLIQKALDTLQPFHTISRRINKLNQIRYIESRGNVELDEDKNLVRLYGICLDITERVEFENTQIEFTQNLEQKVEERTKELSESRKELEKALEKEKKLGELKSHFVSTVSHQFRTPMAIIQSNSELINMITGNENEKLIVPTERIRREITRMTNLMDDVLILGKVNAEGGLKASFSDTDILALCKGVSKEFNSIQKDGRSVEFHYSGTVRKITTDPNLIRHALSNLLSNAFKYSTKSNPRFDLIFENHQVKFIISDDGIGIPKSDQTNLFQAFFRGSNTDNIEGTGLGLAIVKEYIEMNKGKIEVNSEAKKGTSFTISLPIN